MAPKINVLVLLLGMLLSPLAQLFSQIMTTWKGGTPGRETEWQCPQNWVGNKIPDPMSNVLIPAGVMSGSLVSPTLNSKSEINSLRIEGSSKLSIGTKGVLTVYTSAFYPQEESLDVKGILIILNEHLETPAPVSRGRLAAHASW